MIARRIPLVALMAFAPGASAQQPASPSAAPQKKSAPAPQASQPQAPQGNLIIQVMADNGAPVPGAAIEVDGMRSGGAPAGPGTGRSSTLPSGTRIIGADPSPSESGASPTGPGEANPSESTIDQSGLFRPQKRPCPAPQPANSRPGKSQSQSGATQTGQAASGSAKPNTGTARQPSQPPPPPDCGLTNMVQAGTAESISELGGTPSDAAAAALPPGAVPLETDAQGQLILQLPPGEHTLSVSVYGFDPFTGHFTLGGKHRQIVQIKLNTAPTTYVLAVGPDGRIQPESPDLGTLIPLEPVQTLDSLPARNRKHLL